MPTCTPSRIKEQLVALMQKMDQQEERDEQNEALLGKIDGQNEALLEKTDKQKEQVLLLIQQQTAHMATVPISRKGLRNILVPSELLQQPTGVTLYFRLEL